MSSGAGSGELLITSLVRSGVIKKPIFGLYLGTTKQTSKI
jgi:hypothetical protein